MQNATFTTKQTRAMALAISPKTARLLAVLCKGKAYTGTANHVSRKQLQAAGFGTKGYALWLGAFTKPQPGGLQGQGLVTQTHSGVQCTPFGRAVYAQHKRLYS